jgi:hypothetical protein
MPSRPQEYKGSLQTILEKRGLPIARTHTQFPNKIKLNELQTIRTTLSNKHYPPQTIYVTQTEEEMSLIYILGKRNHINHLKPVKQTINK